MNESERRMTDILSCLRENHHVIGVKAEFEDEGTRLEESLRLKEITAGAGLDLTIKIGGCAALSDMRTARVIGVSCLVAPMIETPYALKKFLTTVRQAFPAEDLKNVALCANIETIDACRAFDEMLAIPGIGELGGIVLGRVDLVGSMVQSREDINSPKILEVARELFTKAKHASLETAVGGGIDAQALSSLRRLPAGLADRYETRKVIFGCPGALEEGAERAIPKAVEFELLWLRNKRDYHNMIAREDDERIGMLESRHNVAT